MLESVIESRLRQEAKKRGGMALKFVSPGMNGVRPYRPPAGREDGICGIEGSGKVPRALQGKKNLAA